MKNLSTISAYSNFGSRASSFSSDRYPNFSDEQFLSKVQHFEYLDSIVENTKNSLAQLSHWHHSENFIDSVTTRHSPIVFSSDLLERLSDPRAFLYALKKCSILGLDIYIYLVKHQPSSRWEDDNALLQFLINSGFTTTPFSSETVKLGIDLSKRFQALTGIDIIHTHTVIVTTEDAEITPCGGIGTYIKTIRDINKQICILYANHTQPHAKLPERTISPANFGIKFQNIEEYCWGNGIIETLKCILFLFPNIGTIEFQDYQAIGLRITQARLSGVFPPNLRIRVFLHGSIDHVKHGLGQFPDSFYSYHELQQAAADRFIFNNVDEAFSPSSFLATAILESEFGHKLNNLKITGLPFILDNFYDSSPQFSAITNIAFIGKYNPLKGWPHFVDAIKALEASGDLTRIKSIITLTPISSKSRGEFSCPEDITFQELHLPHADFISYIRTHSKDTLFVIPAAHENYPYVALEASLNLCRAVYVNRGGLAELFNSSITFPDISCAPSANELASTIRHALSIPESQWKKICEDLFLCIKNKVDCSNNFFSTLGPTICPAEDESRDFSFDCTVIIPVYNTNLKYLKELFDSIFRSSLLPSEILIVNDGSSDQYVGELVGVAQEKLVGIPYRILTKGNGGLASARNYGVRHATTKFAYCIDSDDVLLPGTLINSITALNINKDAIIAAGFSINFRDSSDIFDPIALIKSSCYWKPLGIAEARALAFYQNEFIPASALVNVKKIIEIGGWDDQDKSTWEDYALYEKIAWQGKQFLLIPEPGYLYRDTPGSMSKTYNRYFGRRRLIRNIAGLDKLDSNILFNLISNSNKVTPNEFRIIQLLRSARKLPYMEKFTQLAIKIVRRFIS